MNLFQQGEGGRIQIVLYQRYQNFMILNLHTYRFLTNRTKRFCEAISEKSELRRVTRILVNAFEFYDQIDHNIFVTLSPKFICCSETFYFRAWWMRYVDETIKILGWKTSYIFSGFLKIIFSHTIVIKVQNDQIFRSYFQIHVCCRWWSCANIYSCQYSNLLI